MSSPMSNTSTKIYYFKIWKVEVKHTETQCKAPPLAPCFVFSHKRTEILAASNPFSAVFAIEKVQKKKKKFINTKFKKTSGIRGGGLSTAWTKVAKISSVFVVRLRDPIRESVAFENPARSTEIGHRWSRGDEQGCHGERFFTGWRPSTLRKIRCEWGRIVRTVSLMNRRRCWAFGVGRMYVRWIRCSLRNVKRAILYVFKYAM